MKQLNQEELLQLLQQNNVTPSQLAAIAASIGKVEVQEPTQSTGFRLVMAEYPDFAIERTTPKTTRQLVIMPSCGKYFIRDLTKGTAIELSSESYVNFMSGAPNIEMPDNFWLTTMDSGKVFYEQLIDYLENEDIITMIKGHCAPKFRGDATRYDIKEALIVFTAQPNLYKEYFDKPKAYSFLRHRIKGINDIIDSFGLEHARSFLDTLLISNVREDFSNSCSILKYGKRYDDQEAYYTVFDREIIRPQINMNFDKMLEYMMYDSVHFGYTRLTDFVNDWSDDLLMQIQVFGKIKEKYPDALPMHHLQMVRKKAIWGEKVDSEKLWAVAELNKHYEMEIKKEISQCAQSYIFRLPRTQAEFMDEADQQNNCLVNCGYCQKVTNGECLIFFMRNSNYPEQSLVTIEVAYGDIVQAKAACNHQITHEQDKALQVWAKKCKFNIVNK